MRIDAKAKLFFGFKIDSKMREAMAQATPGDRRYFDDPNSPFLRIMSNGEDQWIGKVIDGGIAPTEVEDIQRNVISILNRVAAGGRHSANAMRIFVLEDNAPVVPPPAPEPATPAEDDPDAARPTSRYTTY